MMTGHLQGLEIYCIIQWLFLLLSTNLITVYENDNEMSFQQLNIGSSSEA